MIKGVYVFRIHVLSEKYHFTAMIKFLNHDFSDTKHFTAMIN